MLYPATFTQSGKYFVVTFRDVPEAITQGRTWEEALIMAEDALKVSTDFYTEANKDFPLPSDLQPNDVLINYNTP